MWSSAALALLLSCTPAQAGKLEVTNVRATHGVLGAPRTDAKILPGDILHLAFDIGGLQSDAQGRMRFGVTIELFDAKDKSVFKQDLGEVDQVNVFGAGRTRYAVRVATGVDKPEPGTYRLKVIVTDVFAKRETSFTHPFTILPPDFGLVRFQLTYDPWAQVPAPPAGVVGQILYVNAVAVGMRRDPKNDNQSALFVEMTVLDEQNKPTLAKPLTGNFTNIPGDVTALPFRFDLPIQRAGRYTLVLTATDQLSKKKVTLHIPLTVTDPIK
jgi:hypothetical protein